MLRFEPRLATLSYPLSSYWLVWVKLLPLCGLFQPPAFHCWQIYLQRAMRYIGGEGNGRGVQKRSAKTRYGNRVCSLVRLFWIKKGILEKKKVLVFFIFLWKKNIQNSLEDVSFLCGMSIQFIYQGTKRMSSEPVKYCFRNWSSFFFVLIVWLGRSPITSLMSKMGFFLYLISAVILERFFLVLWWSVVAWSSPRNESMRGVSPRFMQVC